LELLDKGTRRRGSSDGHAAGNVNKARLQKEVEKIARVVQTGILGEKTVGQEIGV